MIYGLYLSASGVLANSYRVDVISNNLANSETTGFKRSLALFQQRRTEAQELGNPSDPRTNKLLEPLGGGLQIAPTFVDQSQGTLETTNNNLNAGIYGKGFFAVKTGNETRLTRNGAFMVDRQGSLILADGSEHKVLDNNGNPINLGNTPQSQISIGKDGTISLNNQPVAKLGFFDVPDPSRLQQVGSTMLGFQGDLRSLSAGTGTIVAGHLENSNVDPTTELTQLIDTQRQLEANANMIRMQDQSLSRLVNDVAKIG